MNRRTAQFIILPLSFFTLTAACSSEPADAPGQDLAQGAETASAPAGPAPSPAPLGSDRAEGSASSDTLTLAGLDTLRIGDPVPADGSWGERGAQISGSCRTINSADFPGAYAIAENGVIRRITIGRQSAVKLSEGIGIGASEADVRAAFPSFREEPHKYVESPGKYLTAPNAASGDPALRFEIGQEGKVSLIHVGTMPVLGYVEGCA